MLDSICLACDKLERDICADFWWHTFLSSFLRSALFCDDTVETAINIFRLLKRDRDI